MRTKSISADEAHEIRKDHVIVADGVEIMLKRASAPSSWNSANRSARFVMTAQTKDLYGDIVVTAGVDTTQFANNPKALINHNSNEWAIGTWGNVEKILRGRPPRMEGDLVLGPAGGPILEIDQAAWSIEHGLMNACSIGFVPDWNAVEKVLEDDGSWDGGIQYNATLLLECSLCDLPANPQALAKSMEGGVKFSMEAIDIVLRTWARSPEGQLMSREDFEKTYQLIKSAGDDVGAVADLLGRMDEQAALALCEKHIVAKGKVVVEQSRIEAIERSAKQKRLDEARRREKMIRDEKIEQLRKSG